MSKRKDQEKDAEAWVRLRNASIGDAAKFLFRLGETGPRSAFPRVLFIQGMESAAGLTTFLDRLQPRGERRIRISCSDDDSRDPLFEVLAAALWHLVVTRGDACTRLCDALATHTTLPNTPSPEAIRKMVEIAGGAEVPHRFLSQLPVDFGQLAKTLAYVDGSPQPWRLFVDDALITKDHRTLAGAMQFRHPANLEIAIGMRWTSESVRLVEEWRRAHREDVAVVKLEPPAKHGVRPKTGRSEPFHALFFPVVREGGTPREERWNAQAIDLIVKTTAALDGIAQDDVEQLGALYRAQTDSLQQLLADYDRIQTEDGGYSVTPAWRDSASSDDLVRFVEEALAAGTSNPAADWLVRIARRDAKRVHEDPLAPARAVILSAAAYYVKSNRAGHQAEAASSATVLARYLQEHASTPSDRHFAILAALYRDSNHLSIIDYGLSLMTRRNDDPSFDEMRFFAYACRAARRYTDRQISEEAAALAAGERLLPWVVPLELGLLTYALRSVWTAGQLKKWLQPFEARLGEFGLLARVDQLCEQEKRLAEGGRQRRWGRAPRKVVQAVKRRMRTGGSP